MGEAAALGKDTMKEEPWPTSLRTSTRPRRSARRCHGWSREAESCAFADCLGREEWLKQARHDFRRHAGPSVGHREHDARIGEGHVNRQGAARDGIASRSALTARFMTICSICPRSAITNAGSGWMRQDRGHVFLDETPQHGPHFPHHHVQIEQDRLDDLLSG